MSTLSIYVKKNGLPSATPENIKAARAEMGDTQTEAARVVHSTCRAWQKWEAGDARMSMATWELYLLKSGII